MNVSPRALLLGAAEARANWKRNAIFGLILLVSIGTQLFTALSRRASEEAVSQYGRQVFGLSESYVASVGASVGYAQLMEMRGAIAEIHESYPWFKPALATDISVRYRTSDGEEALDAHKTLSARAIDSNWTNLTTSVANDDALATVVADDRLAPSMIVNRRNGALASLAANESTLDLRASGSTAGSGSADISAVPANGASADGQGGDPLVSTASGPLGPALRHVPVLGSFVERNKSLGADVMISQSVIPALAIDTISLSAYWQCDPALCADSLGLVKAASTKVGLSLGTPTRFDESEDLAPVLGQQARDGKRYSLLILLLGAAAVAVVSSAFIESRSPRFAILRSLGASRTNIAFIALFENLATALVVGVVASAAAAALVHVNPNTFNQIKTVRVSHVGVPIRVYVETVVLTLAIGLATGFFPAIRAYRSVIRD